MPRPRRARRPSLTAALLVVSFAALAVAAAAAMALAGAKPPTLRVAANVHVSNTAIPAPKVRTVDTHEAVAVGPAGYAVYTFQGETTHHIICQKTTSAKTNCWAFWPPVSVASAKALGKPAGVGGKLGAFRNHGTLQLTLNGQPLYYFTPDLQAGNKKQALGDELKTFGSVWHVVKAAGASHAAPAPVPMPMPTTTASPTPYPNY